MKTKQKMSMIVMGLVLGLMHNAHATSGAYVTGRYRNLFAEQGYTEQEIDAKVRSAYRQLFHGHPETQSLYYPMGHNEQGPLAQIRDINSRDVRSEGMSYGMMIAVQMNLRSQFDKLWKFAKTHMQYHGDSTGSLSAWKHYFRWQLTDIDASGRDEWKWTRGETTAPAPDGEEYFAMSLYLADRRWGSSGTVDYKKEADAISNALLNNRAAESRCPVIDRDENLIVFVPYGESAGFTDPSYHLPAFYECFASWGPEENAARWSLVAEKSRQHLVDAAYPGTGLHPDYAGFDGTPVTDTGGTRGTGLSGTAHDTFRHDAWRVPMNMAMDWAWTRKDSRMKAGAEAYHAFFGRHFTGTDVSNSLFSLDGGHPKGGGSTALTASLAAAGMVSDHVDVPSWIRALWNIEQQEGPYRYFQECIYLLGLLNVSGLYRISWNG